MPAVPPPASEDDGPEETFSLVEEIEIFVEADGSVTFADLAVDLLPVAAALNPGDDRASICWQPGTAGLGSVEGPG